MRDECGCQNQIRIAQMHLKRKCCGEYRMYSVGEWTDNEQHIRAQNQHVKLSDKRSSLKSPYSLRAHSDDPMKQILFEPSTNRPEHIRRVGRPRANWLVETCRDAFMVLVCDLRTDFDETKLSRANLGSCIPGKQPRSSFHLEWVSTLTSTSSNRSLNTSPFSSKADMVIDLIRGLGFAFCRYGIQFSPACWALLSLG